jgi:hypothetical protein
MAIATSSLTVLRRPLEPKDADLVLSAITRERGHRSRHLVEQGTGLGAVIDVGGGQHGGDDLAGVGVHAEMQMLWGRRRGDGTIVAGSVMELPHAQTS